MYLYTEIYDNTKLSWPKKSKIFGLWIRIRTQKEPLCLILKRYLQEGCINCAILLSGIGARGVSSEHGEHGDVFLFSNLGAH